MTAAVVALSSATLPGVATAAPVDVNVNINGYLPAPQGMHVYVDSGRPYYVERGHRVYMKRDRRYYERHEGRREYREHEEHGRGRKLGHMKEHRREG